MVAAPTTLRWVLENVASIPWDHALYLPPEKPWTLDTRSLVLNPDSAEDEEEPAEARAQGLRYALGVQDVKGVAENARQQRRDLTTAELLRALLHYHDHDAFIDLAH